MGLGLFAWYQHSARIQAERSLGLDAARMVDAAFAQKAEIKVGELTGPVTVKSEYDGRFFDSEQETTMPASVDYFLDLNAIDKRSYRWDAQNNALHIQIPDVKVGKPNLDESKAVAKQKGVVVSRKAGRELAKQASERAEAKASETAKHPEHMNRARTSAREAIARLARDPLVAAGLGEVRVAVTFPWEPTGDLVRLDQRWDQSRRPEEILSEKQRQPR